MNVLLEALGDAWSLLIVRDLIFFERKTFTDFLSAEEGIATNILSERLHRLETHGIIEKLGDPDDARRYIYRLTEKGFDLAPVLVEMILWAARHETTDAPPETVREMAENRNAFLAAVRERWKAGVSS
ncbi:MAG: helix-turn-helix transcriptional regulator [Deltaproteobacteria bacterium]|nr:helix-turn-helix transcriptional regulator [Deltaproteobacteria bacterium]